jgi:serine protease
MKLWVTGLRLSVLLGGLVAAAAFPSLYGQKPQDPMNYDGAAGGVRIIEEGQPPVLIHPTVDAFRLVHEAHSSGGQSSGTVKNLSYHGGISGAGVETAPKIYLVLWGSQWTNNDPSGEASILEKFFNGVGGSSWQNTVTQYCQGVSSGTISCNGAGQAAGNQSGSFITAWSDSSAAAPSHPTQSQLAAEAIRAAQHFGHSSSTSNENVQYVIATSHGHNASGFGTQYCAWHSSTSSSYGNIAYTNLPYITDAGASCGANFNNLGATAGITIVEGHEMAETITDPFPNTGWLDGSGEEIGDKCAWISSGQGASANISLSTGTFAVQSLWSNAFNGTGGCVLSY